MTDPTSLAQNPVQHSTCECAVSQIKPMWDRHGCLVCEDCYGRITRAHKMSGQIDRPGEVDEGAIGLLREGLLLLMYGERAPGGDETWAKWARKTDAYLRAVDES